MIGCLFVLMVGYFVGVVTMAILIAGEETKNNGI